MKQLTKDQAMAFYDSGKWKSLSNEQIAKFQMQQDRLCVPFGVFSKALGETLGRPVYTHEFGLNRDGLMQELFLGKEPPTMQDIIDMLPAEKTIVLGVSS